MSLYWYVFKFGIVTVTVVLQTFGICCVCRRLGSYAVLQTTKGYVLTGNLKYSVTVSSSDVQVFC